MNYSILEILRLFSIHRGVSIASNAPKKRDKIVGYICLKLR